MRLIGLLVAMAVTPALAQWDSVEQGKLYVSDPAMCDAIEQQGIDGIGEGTTLSFTDGIQAYEFHCVFYDVKSKDNGPFVLVEAICESPGIRYPDLLSISPYQEGTIEVVSLHDTATDWSRGENPEVGITYYTRCDNLDGLPRE